MQILQQTTTGIPQCWKDAWLTFLPKVANPGVARALRPIGLQDIGGKVVLGVIRDRLMPHVMKVIDDLPQYAELCITAGEFVRS